MAIAEAYEIAATHRQYIVPISGAPIRGLIQDFIISSVFLTSKDTFLSKEQYNQLIYASLYEFLNNKKNSFGSPSAHKNKGWSYMDWKASNIHNIKESKLRWKKLYWSV